MQVDKNRSWKRKWHLEVAWIFLVLLVAMSGVLLLSQNGSNITGAAIGIQPIIINGTTNASQPVINDSSGILINDTLNQSNAINQTGNNGVIYNKTIVSGDNTNITNSINNTNDAGINNSNNKTDAAAAFSTSDIGVLAAPTQGTPLLNTTNPATNGTSTNLTAYNISTADGDNDLVRNIYNWQVDGVPILSLNMPFEGINGTSTYNAWDYSGYGNNASENNGVIWESTGGFDGKGAYLFDDVDDYLSLGNPAELKGTLCKNGCTFSAWIYLNNSPSSGLSTNSHYIITRYLNSGNNRFFDFAVNNAADPILLIHYNGSNSPQCLSPISGQKINQNEWTYLTGRYNGTHSAIFINGVERGSTACSFTSINASAWDSGTQQTYIGSLGGGVTVSKFNGTIDELQVFNRSLSNEQILALYNNQSNTIVSQETNKNEYWNVSITPNDGSGDGIQKFSNTVKILNSLPTQGTPILNTTDPIINDTYQNLTAYNTSTADTDGDLVKNIYNWQVDGNSITLLNMPFEGINGTTSSNAWDYSGYGYTGSEQGGISWMSAGGYDGKGAYKFDGTNSYLDLGNDIFDTRGKGTITAWINTSDFSTNTIFASASDTDSNNFLRFALRTSSGINRIAIGGQFGAGPISREIETSSDSIQPNTWTFVAVTSDGSSWKLYIDGNETSTVVLAGSNSGDWFDYTDSQTDTNSYSIGALQRAGGTTNYFNGIIDDLQVYNITLSPEQIWNLYVNKTNEIVHNETNTGEYWNVSITPNDGSNDGSEKFSNTVKILSRIPNNAPTQGTPILNTTNLATNSTSTNLTAYNTSTADTDGETVKNIYNWYMDGSSITLLNMPFERINGTNSNNAWDYSGYGNNASDKNNIFWNSTGGYDGRGAYVFDGTSTYLALPDNSFDTPTSGTITAWVKVKSFTSTQTIFAYSDSTSTNDYLHFSLTKGGNLSINVRISGTDNRFDSVTNISKDNWTFVAVRSNGVDDTDLFINGQEVGIYSYFGTDTEGKWFDDIGSAAELARIGVLERTSLESYLNGTLDELMVFNRSLSNGEIWNLYQNKTDELSYNETKKDEYWNVSITPNDNIDDGAVKFSNTVKILNAAPTQGTPILNITNPATNDTNQNLTVYNTSTFDADNDLVKNIYNWQVDGKSLALVNMPFEGINGTSTNNSWDYSGYNNAGVIINEANNATWNSTGGYDGRGAYQFDGINDFIDLGTGLPASINSFGFSAWYKTTSTLTLQSIYIRESIETYITISPSFGQLVFRHSDIGDGQTTSSSPGATNDGSWHFVYIGWNGTNTTIFQDGSVIATEPATGTISYSGTTTPAIGKKEGGLNWFNGSLDEVMIWNRSLTPEQVQALYNNRTDLIVSQETNAGEYWNVSITPNDGP